MCKKGGTFSLPSSRALSFAENAHHGINNIIKCRKNVWREREGKKRKRRSKGFIIADKWMREGEREETGGKGYEAGTLYPILFDFFEKGLSFVVH